MANFLSNAHSLLYFEPTPEVGHFDDFLDRCNVVAPPPVGQIPPTENPFCKPLKLRNVGADGRDLCDTVTVDSENDADATKVDAQSQTEQATSSDVDGNVATPVDDDGSTVDNGVNAEAQVDAITPSHSVDTAEGGAISGVVLADNADVLVTKALSKGIVASSEVTGTDKLPALPLGFVLNGGAQPPEHQGLKLECPKKLEAASLPNFNLITSALPEYPQHFFKEDFLGKCVPTKEISEGYFVRRTTPEFPTNCLYPWMKKHVKAVSSALNVSEAAPTFTIYGLGSTCIRGTAVLEI